MAAVSSIILRVCVYDKEGKEENFGSIILYDPTTSFVVPPPLLHTDTHVRTLYTSYGASLFFYVESYRCINGDEGMFNSMCYFVV